MFDVVRKPVEGAQTGGIWGFGTGVQDLSCPKTFFVKGLVKGAAGTLVKPVAAIGTAFGEARPESRDILSDFLLN